MSLERSLAVASLLGLCLSFGCSSSSSSGQDPDASTASLCPSKCARSNAANCGDQATCLERCQSDVAAVPPSCKTQLDTLAACAITATYTCVGGYAVACNAELTALNTCIMNLPAPGTPEAGSPEAGGNTERDAGRVVDPSAICTTDSSDDPCFACDQAKCCAQLTACMADSRCVDGFLCVNTCVVGDTACLAACLADPPSTLVAVSTCHNTSCSAECAK
jgi:hypothetical protein